MTETNGDLNWTCLSMELVGVCLLRMLPVSHFSPGLMQGVRSFAVFFLKLLEIATGISTLNEERRRRGGLRGGLPTAASRRNGRELSLLVVYCV